jgi:hypothetical protein
MYLNVKILAVKRCSRAQRQHAVENEAAAHERGLPAGALLSLIYDGEASELVPGLTSV